MDSKSISNSNVFSSKLKDYFKDNVKISLKTIDKVFVVTKSDIFYAIDIFDVNLQSFISSNENSIIEKMIVKELCHKKISDVTYGKCHYIAKTDDNRIYCWGNNCFGQLGVEVEHKDLLEFKRPELNEFLSDLNVIVIKCGYNHSLALTQTGEVYGWGSNEFGQIGNGCYINQFIPIKLNVFEEDIVIDISCGLNHSMALTKSGRVFSWGLNTDGQLGVEGPKNSNTPTLIEINNVLISKISCGTVHSLLISKDGVIYAFGNKSLRKNKNRNEEIQKIPTKLNHEKKFEDIATHWTVDCSTVMSFDKIYFFCAVYEGKWSLLQIQTELNSFNQIFVHNYARYLEISRELIEFNDLFIRHDYYNKYIIEMEKLGEGGYGVVYKAKHRQVPNKIFAIKKVACNKKYKDEILREINRFSTVEKLQGEYIVNHFNAWLENDIKKEEVILYILMTLCDKTLEEVINEIQSDCNFAKNNALTPIGYYILSKLFTEILGSVQYLHERNIIHRDLNPCNIMLKIDFDRKRLIKIVDFGLIAIHAYADQSHSSDKGNTKYMAPEVFDGRIYDTKADLYSLGEVLKRLFAFDRDEPFDENRIPSTILLPKYNQLIKLIENMTQNLPEDRPSCKEILEEKHLWALSRDEFDFESELKKVLNSEERIFVHSILELEFIEINDKEMERIQSNKYKEKHLTNALNLYKYRPFIVQDCLFYLKDCVPAHSEPRTDLTELIIILMKEHTKSLDIHMIAIECLYRWTLGELQKKLDLTILENVVKVTVDSMELFPHSYNILALGSLILFSDHILQNIPFNRYKCIKLAMDFLIKFKDTEKETYGVCLCENITKKLSIIEKSKIGSNPVYMETLLDIVRRSLQLVSEQGNIEIIGYIFSILITLTDEMPKTCELFVEKGGIDLCFIILSGIFDQKRIETLVIQLLNNVAEVSHLRNFMMNPEFLSVLRKLMNSQLFKESFLAAAVLAHLCSDGMKSWSNTSIDLNIILSELMNAVINWKIPEFKIVAYRSFLPLLPLLNNESAAVQLYAIWTIHYVCSTEPERYCAMILKDIGSQTIKIIQQKSKTNKEEPLKSFCVKILEIIEKNEKEMKRSGNHE